MHSVLVTFRSSASPADLGDGPAEIAQAVCGVPGLVSKAWLHDGDTLGGFYVFTDRAAADAYLDGEVLAKVRAIPAFSDFQVRHFTVMEEFSVLNGTPSTALAAR